MDGVTAVGVVPDEVLLLCGRPASAPSTWWTPRLAELAEGDADRLRAAAVAVLDDAGIRDPDTGALRGVLGDVAAVVDTATVLLLLETTRGGVTERRSVVVAPDRALLDLQEPAAGRHDLVLADPAATSLLLCGLLAADLAAPTPAVCDLAGPGTVAAVLAALPADERRSVHRIVRVERGGADAVAHDVTVVHHDEGSVACWAVPDRDLLVQVLDGDDGVADLALVLLGAEDLGGPT